MKNVERIPNTLKKYIDIYAGSSLPVILTDPKLYIIYCNQKAKDMYPVLDKPDGLKVLVSSCDSILSVLFEQNASQELAIPFTNQYISITPVKEENKPIGTIVFIVSSLDIDTEVRTANLSKMLNAFSTQFREPLANINSVLSLMRQKSDVFHDETFSMYYKILNQNSYRMLRNIANLTDIMAIASGVDIFNMKLISLHNMIDSLCEALKVLLASVNLSFSYDICENDVTFIGDKEKLVRAIIHIVSNSAKASKDNNQIHLSAKIINDNIVISISDKGIGISEKYVNKVFEPYFAITNQSTSSTSLGLGLSIVKYIISAHGGTVVLNSLEGEGTTVVFTIPIKNDQTDISFSSDTLAIDYLADKFSDLYIGMSDVCKCPEN